MRWLLSGALSASLLAVGCDDHRGRGIGSIPGNGDIIEEVRSVGDFTSIEVSGALPIQFEIGSVCEVAVVADENIAPFVLTEVDDGKLEIRMEGGVSLRPTRGIRILVTSPALEKLELTGASRASLKGLNGDRLSIEGNGASSVIAEGRIRHLEVDLSGASQLDASALRANEASVDLSGASSAHFEVEESLEGEVSGASRVTYSGGAEKIEINSSGASTVKRVKATIRRGGEL